jgi:hypothetical protein
MYEGKLVFAQLMEHLPTHTFRRIVKRYDGDHKVQSFSYLDQFFCMAFAQLTDREILRDIYTEQPVLQKSIAQFNQVHAFTH